VRDATKRHRHSWHYVSTFTRRCMCGVTQRWGALTAWRDVPKLSAAQRRRSEVPR